MTPDAALFPSPKSRRAIDQHLTEALAAADERVRLGPVTPSFDRDSFRADLAGLDFASPRPLAELCDWAIAQLEHGVVHMTHSRYLGLFNPAPSFPAQCADRIAASFNPQLATGTTSPTAVAIEAHVIRAVARRAGLPDGGRGPLHLGRIRSERDRADLRADPGGGTVRDRGGSRLHRAARVLHLAGQPSRLDQAGPHGRHRPHRRSAGADRPGWQHGPWYIGRPDRDGPGSRLRPRHGGGNRRHDQRRRDRPLAGVQ